MLFIGDCRCTMNQSKPQPAALPNLVCPRRHIRIDKEPSMFESGTASDLSTIASEDALPALSEMPPSQHECVHKDNASSTMVTDEEFSATLSSHSEGSWVSMTDGLAAQTAICFDWDDTLFPSQFISKVVEPWMKKQNVERLTDTPFYKPLSRHAQRVEDVIRMACSLGRVCIVTLAKRSWVTRCAELYLPGLDLHELVSVLNIPIMYARDFVKRRMVAAADGEGGVDLQAIAKMRAMTKVLQRFSSPGLPMTNWISIGDSTAERDALMEYAWSYNEEADQDILCKTVEFLSRPTLDQLDAELHVLMAVLPRVVFSPRDTTIVVENDWVA